MKYDISSIMKAAWSEARHYAKSRTGSAREFFDFCLRQAWFEARSRRLSGTQNKSLMHAICRKTCKAFWSACTTK